MNSTITKVTPIATQTGTTPEITLTGTNFTDGGDPVVYLDDVSVKLNSFTATEIKMNIPKSLPVGVFNITVLNGEEQP